jgi:hypothetical protein
MEPDTVMVQITTKDNKVYKLEQSLLTNYSKYLSTMLEDNQEDGLTLYNIDSWEFDFIY